MHNDMTAVDILRRVEMGTTDVDDAQALRDLLRPSPEAETYSAAMLLLARADKARTMLAPDLRLRLGHALLVDLEMGHASSA